MVHNEVTNIVFICPPHVHLLDVNGPAHVFYEAQCFGAPLNLIFSSINGEDNIRSSAGLHFFKLQAFNTLELTSRDFVFIPGSENMPDLVGNYKKFKEWLVQMDTIGVNLCSVCVGVYWLAEAGLLNFKKGTSHWKYISDLKSRYPAIKIDPLSLFVIEGNLYSSAGVTSGIDMSLYILEHLFGFEMALKVSKEIVYYLRRSGSDTQISPYLLYRDHLDHRIHDAQDYIMKNISKSINLDTIADHVNMSKRNFTRHFKSLTGVTTWQYIDQIRAERARHLLAKGLKMDQVAFECGLKSTPHLRKLLARSY